MKRRGKVKSGHLLLRLFSWFIRSKIDAQKIMKTRGKVKSGHLLLWLLYWFIRSSFYVWLIIKIGIAIFHVHSSSKWYLPWRYMVCNFLILSLVNNARLLYWFIRSSFYVWLIIKIGIAIFHVHSSSKWYLPWRYMVCNFLILSLVNNASYLQTFVFGLMLMHN